MFRDVFPVILKQLQALAFSCNLSFLESQRVSAVLGVAEAAIRVISTSMHGQPAPSLTWQHAVGMATPLLHSLSVWSKESYSTRESEVRVLLLLLLLLLFV